MPCTLLQDSTHLALCSRLAECTDLLITLVVPRLRLRDCHSLRQTCRACRHAIAGADPQLQDLALVRGTLFAHCKPTSRVPEKQSFLARVLPRLTPGCMQALMPRKHLASQALIGASVLQQLDALAALHARIRLEQPALVSAMPVEAPFGRDTSDWCTSPALPSCIAVAWARPDDASSESDDDWDGPEDQGAEVFSSTGDSGSWSSMQPQAVPMRVCWPVFSQCGQWLVALCETSVPPGLLPRVVVSVFSVAQQSWLCEMSLPHAMLKGICHINAVFSDSCPPLACAIIGSFATDYRTGDRLLVLGVSPPFLRCVPTGLLERIADLPGTNCIVLLKAGCLARFNLLSPPSSPAWVPLPESDLLAWTAIAPAGQALWASQKKCSLDGQGGAECGWVHLSVYAAGTMTCRGYWRLEVSQQEKYTPRIYASTQAVALGGSHHVSVYALTGTFTLGPRLYCTAANMTGISFSADGCFLLGAMDHALNILDARTGAIISRLTPASFPDVQLFSNMRMHCGNWGGPEHSGLLITCTSTCSNDMMFCDLAW